MDTAAAILLMSELPGVGEKTLGTVLRRCVLRGMEPAALFDLSSKELRDVGFTGPAVERLKAVTAEMRSAAIATARGLRAACVRILTPQDGLYPKRLLERLEEPPPVLYGYGSSDALAGPTFAVANSNGASEQALASCDAAAEQMVQAGWRPVTGHNRASYQRTALAAMRFGAPLTYVLDRGLLEAFGDNLKRELFPAAHVWSRAYDPSTTLTLTPFPLRAHGIAAHNRRRDALIFALADAVLVGEVRAGGQMEKCVQDALGQGRRVCLVGPTGPQDEALISAGAVRGVSIPG